MNLGVHLLQEVRCYTHVDLGSLEGQDKLRWKTSHIQETLDSLLILCIRNDNNDDLGLLRVDRSLDGVNEFGRLVVRGLNPLWLLNFDAKYS